MREARIILPRMGNNGESLNHVHAGLRRALCEYFGGCTAILVQGSWMDEGKLHQEEGIAYDIAAEDDDAAIDEQFRRIAGRAARDAQQICVYLRLPCGRVEFVKPELVSA
jgi:hypothetical protein